LKFSKKIFLSIFLFSLGSSFSYAQCNVKAQPMPNGHSSYYVFNTDASFAAPANYAPPSGLAFDANVLDRTVAESLARRSEAVDYFLSQYGIDFTSSDTAQGGNIVLYHTMNDLNWKMRTVFSGGQEVPQDGWETFESRWWFTVVGQDARLFGAWGGAGGIGVRQGTAATFGEWVINTEIPCESGPPERKAIYMSFKSEMPIFPDYLGRGAFEFVVEGDPGTDGVANGVSDLRFDPNVPGNIRVISKVIVRFE